MICESCGKVCKLDPLTLRGWIWYVCNPCKTTILWWETQ